MHIHSLGGILSQKRLGLLHARRLIQFCLCFCASRCFQVLDTVPELQKSWSGEPPVYEQSNTTLVSDPQQPALPKFEVRLFYV